MKKKKKKKKKHLAHSWLEEEDEEEEEEGRRRRRRRKLFSKLGYIRPNIKKTKKKIKLKISESSILSLQGMLENILIPYITVLSIY
jgi:hypothetical protein